MNKAIIILAISILASTLAVCGTMMFIRYQDGKEGTQIVDMKDRYFFGVSDTGIINSVADKQSGYVYYRNGSGYGLKFR